LAEPLETFGNPTTGGGSKFHQKKTKKMQLRPYQQAAIEEMRKHIAEGRTRLILCSPTGSGKTVIFSHLAKSALQKGKKVLIVTDRIELLKQSGNALAGLNLEFARIEAGKDTRMGYQLYTAMVETLARRAKDARYEKLMAGFDLAIFDEAHKQSFDKIFPLLPERIPVIGATATPYRKGGQRALKDNYHAIVETIDIPDLIDQGYLSECLTFGVPVDLSGIRMKGGDFDEGDMGREYSKKRVYTGVIENYLRICPKAKTIAFAPNIESSLELCEKMKEVGINARHLDSTMGNFDRVQILAWFKRNPDAVLCNVGILTTGFDEPSVRCVILYRATASLPLFLQMAGRGSRTTPDKDSFYLLDFGENVHRHGFWEEKRKWGLEKAEKKKGVAPSKDCPSCNALLPAQVRECTHCGHTFEKSEEEEKEEVRVELMLLSPQERRKRAMGATLEEKAEMAKAGLIKPYWVLHNLNSMDEAKRFVELMGWKPGWLYINRDRFPNLRGVGKVAGW